MINCNSSAVWFIQQANKMLNFFFIIGAVFFQSKRREFLYLHIYVYPSCKSCLHVTYKINHNQTSTCSSVKKFVGKFSDLSPISVFKAFKIKIGFTSPLQ